VPPLSILVVSVFSCEMQQQFLLRTHFPPWRPQGSVLGPILVYTTPLSTLSFHLFL